MYGFVPTMNGRASRERIRVANRRGISAWAYDTEVSTDSAVRGRPVARRVPSVRGRGGCCAKVAKRWATSGGAGSGVRL